MTKDTPTKTSNVPKSDTISTVSPYLKMEIPYPTTTTKKAVMLVRAIF
jgi:hypothetical protein